MKMNQTQSKIFGLTTCGIFIFLYLLGIETSPSPENRRLLPLGGLGHLLFRRNNEDQFTDPKSVRPRSSKNYFFSPSMSEKFIAPYTIDNILPALPSFTRELFVVTYVSQSDDFVVYVPSTANSNDPNPRIENIMHAVMHAFRSKFPERFQKGISEDLVLLISCGDAPRLTSECFADPDHCGSVNYAPILQFGSGLVDEKILPSLVTMPQPRMHLRCLAEFQLYGKICEMWSPKTPKLPKGLVFGEMVGLEWDDLIPQLVWRGTDFPYMTAMTSMRAPNYVRDVQDKLREYGKTTEGVIRALRDKYERLRPRWKAVLIAAEAQLEASQTDSLPWANMKFSAAPNGGEKKPISEQHYYRLWEELGIPAIGELMSLEELAKYKYHIDIGGGGGTTWTGTIQKLAMPGLLFHHVTPAKDWYHQYLVPWVHYVPVKEDLSDLREKVMWAENHERKARKIANAGTDFVRKLGTLEGLHSMYQENFLKPLSMVIDAYQPGYDMSHSVTSLLDAVEGVSFKEVMRCSGEDIIDECFLRRETKFVRYITDPLPPPSKYGE